MLMGEAFLDIGLDLANARVVGVRLSGGRARGADRLIEGIAAAAAPARAGALFALCGMAHRVAACRAVESALGSLAPAACEAARDAILASEALDNLGFALLAEWPGFLGEAPDAAALRALRAGTARYRRSLDCPSWGEVGGGPACPDAQASLAAVQAIDTALRAGLAGGAGDFADPTAFAAWTRAALSSAARFMALVADPVRAGFGAVPFERSPAKLVAELAKRHGPGLAARFADRVVAALAVPAELRRALARIADPELAAATAVPGVACVCTARGPLRVALAIADGKVARYRSDAPTDANFAPDGPFARALAGATVDGAFEGNARLLALALDPCVRTQLVVREVAHA